MKVDIHYGESMEKKFACDVYVWETECWRCRRKTKVIWADSLGGWFDFQVPELCDVLSKKYPWFKLVFSKAQGEWVYGNICQHCGAYQGNTFVFEEFAAKKNDVEFKPVETVEFVPSSFLKHIAELEEEMMEVEEDMRTCAICGRRGERLLMHHISYEPEDVIYVCNSCHAKIHHGKYPQLLRKSGE